jgi:hypothetical protein
MDIKLLKELNEITREKDEFERALSEAEMELDFDLGDEDDGEDDFDPDDFDYESVELNDDELQRIADHWQEEGADMDDDDLADAIGDDLEQLEYAPEEISAGIMKVMSMLGREDYFGEPSDDELTDIESGKDVDMEDDLGGSERF